MVTKVRPPNKTLWALDECIADHDPEVAELIDKLTNILEREEGLARNRYDKDARLRISEAALTLTRLQLHLARLATLHRLARANEYDKR